MANKWKSRIKESLDIPVDMFSNISQMEVLSNREVIIEGCKNIIEYDDTLIRIAVKNMEIKFFGEKLNLCCLNTDNVIIEGKLQTIEFVTA